MKTSGCSRDSPLQKKRGDDVRDGMDERVNLRVGSSIQTFLPECYDRSLNFVLL